MRAWADDHCTEQDDDKVIVKADESESQDGRINTDADVGNSALDSTGRTTSRGDEEKTGTGGVLVTENGVVSGQGGGAGQETKRRQLGRLVVVTISAEQRLREEGTRWGIG